MAEEMGFPTHCIYVIHWIGELCPTRSRLAGFHFSSYNILLISDGGGDGIRTHDDFRHTGFRDQPIQPL